MTSAIPAVLQVARNGDPIDGGARMPVDQPDALGGSPHVAQEIYGYDARARVSRADDRPAEADDAMTTALALGTRDATLLDRTRATIGRRP